MIEVSHLNEKERLKGLLQEAKETIQGILQILDTEYGAYRDKYEDDGGSFFYFGYNLNMIYYNIVNCNLLKIIKNVIFTMLIWRNIK